MMKILVTGASGFVGRALTERLAGDRNQVGKFSGRLQNREDVKKELAGATLVFNCAAALPHHNKRDQDYWDANVVGVENICAACLSEEAKLVHISTVGIYGATGERVASERSRVGLTDIYSRTKWEGEKIVRKYIGDGLKAIIVRPTIGYGPGDTRPGFLDLFRLVKKGLFEPVGNGANYFHTFYIDNLVDSLLLVAKRRIAVGEDFIVGDDPCPRMGDVVEEIYGLSGRKMPRYYIPKSVAYAGAMVFGAVSWLGVPAILSKRRVEFITDSRRFSTAKIRRILGYRPKVSLGQGMKKTYNWYSKEGYL